VQGVAAHRLADEPSRNQRPAWNGPHPVRMRRLTVARDGLYAQWYAPTDLKRDMPAIVVFGGSNGGLSEGPFAAAFASYGYPALALAYFKAPGLPQQLRRIPLEYFERAIRFARRQPGVSRVVVCGASRGGEAALLLGSTYPQLVSGVIGIVPNYQVGGGWTLRGKLIPYDAPIRVERIRGPVLTASGGRDQVWSSSVYTEQIELRLDDAHFRFPHARLDYPDEGHSLAGVQADLWRHVRAFMRRLPAAPPGPARGS
jgi:pimeloyl-ACP methyl ester carboxylesterase